MFLLLVLALVGSIALCFMLIDSLWSVLELITSYLMPYFLPSEVQDLSKRFGPWAGRRFWEATGDSRSRSFLVQRLAIDIQRGNAASVMGTVALGTIRVITGGTDGIGKQYALELARRGINIVIISRNPDKLKAVAKEIEKEHSVKTKIVVADFSRGAEVYPHIEEELKDIPVGILVNNVGVQYDYPMPLCETAPSKTWELINVNAGAVTAMTRLVLPHMVQRGRGAVVNVSSGSELQPLPLMTIYAATKAYVRAFTLALREEYAPLGIYIQHLAPMFVSTKINAFSQRLLAGNLLVPDASTYARHAVNTLGRQHNTTGYWLHGIQNFFIKVPPVWLRTKVGMQLNVQFRQEYLQNAKIKSN